MRDIEPAKPKIHHLRLLKRMVEEKVGYCTSSSMGINDRVTGYLWSKVDHETVKDSREWMSLNIPRLSDTSHCFYKWGWCNGYSKEKHMKFAWYDTPRVLTKQGREYWETTGEVLYEELLVKEAAELDRVSRYVVIGKKTQMKRDRADRKAAMLVRVVRETAKRLYVEIVHQADKTDYDFEIVEGTKGKRYISRDQVWMDGVSEAQYHRIVQCEDDIVAEKVAIRKTRDDDIAAIRRASAERLDQLQAEFDDRLNAVTEMPETV